MRIIGIGLAVAVAALACAPQAARAEDIRRHDGAAVLKLRIPFGPGVQERRRTLTLAYAPTSRPEIEAPAMPPLGINPVIEVGLDFNGDAFLNLAQAEVLRAVRAGLREAPEAPLEATPPLQ